MPRLPLAKMAIEALLIVTSILLAFAIDAWWDERNERSEEAEILDLLHAEYEANARNVAQIIEGHLTYRAQVEALLGSSDEEIRQASPETLSEYVLAMCNPWTFDPALGTTDALVSSGKLDLLRHRPLRVALTTFINRVNDAAEDAAYLTADAKNTWQAEIEIGGPWTDPATEIGFFGNIEVPAFVPKATVEDVLRIRQSQRLIGTIGRCHINVGYYLQELYQLQDQADLVLDLVELSK